MTYKCRFKDAFKNAEKMTYRKIKYQAAIHKVFRKSGKCDYALNIG